MSLSNLSSIFGRIEMGPILIIVAIILIIFIIKGLIKRVIGIIATVITLILGVTSWSMGATNPYNYVAMIGEKIGLNTVPKLKILSGEETKSIIDQYQPLTGDETSSVDYGAARFGATFVLGDLDGLGRATYSHIRVKYAQEPRPNGIIRPERITTNPAGWNGNLGGKNDRTHLVGFQFSGVNSDPRNLVTATAYMNRGTTKGMNSNDPNTMLFYEQQFDKWLKANQTSSLDLLVVPNYDGNNLVPSSITMTWVGIKDTGEQVLINTGGRSTMIGDISTVTLENVEG